MRSITGGSQELSMEVLKEARIHGVDLYEEYQRSACERSNVPMNINLAMS